MQIRGLVNFIGDIRNCKTEEDERSRVDKELAKIRASFGKANVGAYAKKKYMWKIMYMYTLGYTVEFGHMQCVDLIRSDTYSEKNVGYVGVSLLLIEHTDMLRMCINTIRNDLKSRNEIFQCLALTCVANVGGPEFAESLVPDVQSLLISGTSRTFVRKKAALCMLRLLRQYPENCPSAAVANQIIKLAEHRNVGVVTSVLSLLTGLATYDSGNYKGVVSVAIKLLHQFVINRECSKEYIYYRTPCPWLQVKLLRILQYYAPPENKTELDRLHDILDRIVTKTEVTQSVNKNHADHSILFEAMNVIIHLNLHGQDMLHDRAIHKLLHFINVKEGNIRYLGLDAMARLAKISGTHKLIKRHLRTIQYSLEDNDISIRKRALDLLYSICDEGNVVEVLDHLLRYLTKAEFGIREEMVLKIAILAEKFATDYQWYIDVILKLMSLAGEYVSEDVWHRVVQIVTNQESLQAYAAGKVYECLQSPIVHESLIKVGGYILGEFGHLIEANEATGAEQFQCLHKHFQSSSAETKALLLSTYMKFVNMYEELSAEILQIFKDHHSSVDPEIQQRSVEYAIMAKYDDQDLITQVWEAMPDFPNREESNLVQILKKKEEKQFTDRDPFSDNNEDDDKDDDEDSSGEYDDDEGSDSDYSEEAEQKPRKKRTREPAQAQPKAQQQQQQAANYQTPNGAASNQTPGSGNGNSNSNNNVNTNTNTNSATTNNETDFISGLFDDFSVNTNANANANVQMLTFDKAKFNKILIADSGVLYEDKSMQIGLKSKVEISGAIMKIILFFGNKTDNLMTIRNISVSNSATVNPDQIALNFVPTNVEIASKQQGQIQCKAVLLQPAVEPPLVKIELNCNNTNYELQLAFPVVVTKFCVAHSFEAAQFRDRWQQLSNQAQNTFALAAKLDINKFKTETIVAGLHLGLIDKVDPNTNNCVACGVIHFGKKKADGNFISMPVLLRIEYNQPINSIRITIRSPHSKTTQSLMNVFENLYAK